MKPPRINQNALELTCAEIRVDVEEGLEHWKGWRGVFELFFGLTWEEALKKIGFDWNQTLRGLHPTNDSLEIMNRLGDLLGSQEVVDSLEVGEDDEDGIYLNRFLFELTDDEGFWSNHDQFIKRKKGVIPVFISYWNAIYYLIFVDRENNFLAIDLSNNYLKWEYSTIKANNDYRTSPITSNEVSGGWVSETLMIFENVMFIKSFNFPQGGVL